MPTALRPCGEWGIALSRNKKAVRRHPRIQHQVMLYMVLFVVLVIGLLWLFQVVLLDDFYRFFKTRTVQSTGEILAQNIDNADLDALAERLSNQNDVCVLILDGEGTPVVSCEANIFCVLHHADSHSLEFFRQIADEAEEPILRSFSIKPRRNDRYTNERFIGRTPPENAPQQLSLLYSYRVTLADGSVRYIMLNATITPLDATVSTLRSQLALITLIVLLLALLLATLLSHRVSSPIVETNQAARALARGKYERPAHSDRYQEISELNDTLVKAADELSQVEHLQQELIANISHDLRTPLTMIGGYAEVMRDIPGENTPENMQIVIDETNRLSSLVTELLDFSKLQAGTLKMEPAPFNLTESISAILTRYNKLKEQDGYQILFTPVENCIVVADESRIGQVVYNLINNALTYTGEDKTVTVTQTIEGDMARIAIHDSGKGISADELPLIWNRYYRAKENHKRAIQGSGLGLSIVRSILEAHNVPYGVDSQEGEGTTFWFKLPLTEKTE